MDKDLQNKDNEQRSKGIFDPGFFPIFTLQGILGLTFTLLSFYIGYYHGDFILPALTTPANANMHLSARLAYALCSSLPMLLSLYAGIEVISIKRACTAAVNPLAGNESLVQVDKNYLSNTLEQFVVSLTLMLTIAAYTDSPQVFRLLPVYSTVFMLGRIFFWIGYRISPFYRTVGMSTTFVSSYIMFGIVFYYSWTRGLASLLGSKAPTNGTDSVGHQEL